jgi:probable rRNA maturation factor
MSYTIDVLNAHNYAANVPALQQAAEAVLKRHEVLPDSIITIVLMNDEEIRALNRQHRGVDRPTDVLSFPAEALPDEIAESPYLGDVLIAWPYTQAQAEQEGFTLADSLLLMVVHGTLHLLGYDHDTPENRAEMWEIQEEVLAELGVPLAIVPAYEDDTDG